MRQHSSFLGTVSFAFALIWTLQASADPDIAADTTIIDHTFSGTTTIKAGVTVTFRGVKNYVPQSAHLINYGTIRFDAGSLTNFGTFDNYGAVNGGIHNGLFNGDPAGGYLTSFNNYGSFVGSLDNAIYATVRNYSGGVYSDNGFGVNWGKFENYGWFETWNQPGNEPYFGFINSHYFDSSNPGIEGTFTNAGTIYVKPGGRFTIAASSLDNQGALDVLGELSGESYAHLDNTGTIQVYGTWKNKKCSTESWGNIYNYGAIANDSSILSRQGSYLANWGAITNAGSFETYGTTSNSGTITSSLIFTNRGDFTNHGTIDNSGEFDAYGFYGAPGLLTNRGEFINRNLAKTAFTFDNLNRIVNAAGATFSSVGDEGIVINRCGAVIDNQGTFSATLDDADADHDGVCMPNDNCPNTANSNQADSDSDGLGDVCDACPNDPANDADGDGVCGNADNCPTVPNANQADADSDGPGDACDACPNDPANDADGDGICGDTDNCPTVANANQSDVEGDGIGDACDPDNDNDGVVNTSDNCPLAYNPDQSDFDQDGAGDACDADVDGDGVLDAIDACPQTAFGDLVDAQGCSIADVAPCTPAGGSTWKNHGAYVRSVAQATNAFVDAGLITQEEADAIMANAGASSCGG